MSYQLSQLGVDHPLLRDTPAATGAFRREVDDLLDERGVRYRRLWAYYANPMRVEPTGDAPGGGSERPYRQAQEWGLPPRLTGHAGGEEPFADAPAAVARKEVVVENDIAWRVDVGVDFLFGRPLVLESAAPDPARARAIGELLRGVLAANGGLAFLQRVALVGAVYGGADVLVKFAPDAGPAVTCATATLGGRSVGGVGPLGALDPSAMIRLELVEPARALPLLAPDDAESLQAYAQVFRVPRDPSRAETDTSARGDWLRRLLFGDARAAAADATCVEITSPTRWQLYRDGALVDGGDNPLGVVPLVHIQNLARPFAYEGAGEVEPLIPLQDELNTRLSDRATRVALQSAKMYLGVGIEGFGTEPVRPGRMWNSDNPEARVTEFGGDAHSPSEQAAIDDVRSALDKQSGVNPVASGEIRGKVGNLTSAAALRLTFQSLLARVERKRVNYGVAIERMCELALMWLDAAEVFATTPDERRVRLTWPDPVPVGVGEQLDQARQKLALGVDPEVVRREIGY